MATDCKIKNIQRDHGAPVSPHFGMDTRFAIVQGLGKDFMNPSLFRIVEIERRQYFWIEPPSNENAFAAFEK